MPENSKTIDFAAATAKRRKKSSRKKKHSALPLVIVVLLILALFVGCVLSVTVLFPINNIGVSGDTPYSAEEIIAASNIQKGKNLFLSGTDAEKRITKKLPYISSVQVQRHLPGNIVLKVTKATPARVYNTNGLYLLVDEKLKILCRQEMPAEGLLTVVGTTAKAGKDGEILTFEKAENADLANMLIDIFEQNEIVCTLLDVTDPLAVKFSLKNGITVLLGSTVNAEKKCRHLKSMLENMDQNASGEIDLTFWSEQNPKGIFTRS